MGGGPHSWYDRRVFRIGRVPAHELAEIARRAAGSEPTYAEHGATLSGVMPSGFRHDRYEIQLPNREDAFERGVEGLRQWAAHRGAGLTVAPSDPPVGAATLAIAAPAGPITAVAVCRVIKVVLESDQFGFAYGTLPGHPECGEEAFTVERFAGGTVFRIVAFSRPAETLARMGGPITRWVQKGTSRRYLAALSAFVRSSTAP